MVLKRLFKEPTSFTLFIATILAIFEAINSAGYSDNIAISLGLIDSTPVAGEKITSPGGVNLDIWGPLKVGTLDYAILAFLSYVIASLWVYRPREDSSRKNKGRIFAIKSTRWIRFGLLSLFLAIISTANKRDFFADLSNNTVGTKLEGSFGLHEGTWGFQPTEWGIADFVELAVFYSLFLFCLWKGIEVDKAKLNPIPDNRNFIERIWGGIRDAERDQRSDIEMGATKANESFTNLVKLLGAATSLNVAAASLDEGDVKLAFNKWKNLTHRKGKQNKDWKGLSESLDQAGDFIEEEE
ncbi:MAG: hypothetical protein CMA12_01930 [Euryarchaeota archaeon]|nr:hypothetical protein [Euryarchaeota archaeon]OUW22803.1 MAG: hypothetical protein CBD33_00505 [Euryarchaeota archaeon TMED173]